MRRVSVLLCRFRLGGEIMERLTTNKEKSEMGMYELAHNSCYCKDGVARYRDFENDIDARDLARELAWSLTDIELSRDNECFDEEMFENLQYDITKEPIGLIALFYRNLLAMADLRERLKEYEDLEEQGLLLRLPCKVGDDIYAIPSEVNYRLNKSFGAKGLNAICRQVVDHIEFNSYGYLVSTNEGMTVHRQEAFGETWFLTRDEAEQKLKEMECESE